MVSGTLALLDRALRESALRMRSHLYRFGFVGVILFCVTVIHSMSYWFGAPGLEFLKWIAWLNFVGISAAGVGLFTAALGEEKEEAAFGLLQLAGINRLSLLLGKSTGQLIAAMLILSLQLPFTFLAVTLGGVTAPQVLALYVALAAYLIGVANVGLLFSILCQRVGTAAVFTALFLGVTTVVPAVLLSAMPVVTIGPATGLWLVLETMNRTSIVGRIGVILATGFAESPFSLQVGTNLAAGGLCFLASWMLLERLLSTDRSIDVPLLSNAMGRGRRSKRAWKNALLWKDFHFIAGGWKFLFAKLLAYAGVVAVIRLLIGPAMIGGGGSFSAIVMIVVLSALIVIELTYYSSRVFHEEIRRQTLSSLRMLPLRIGEIARNKVAGCLLGLLPGMAALFIGSAVTPGGWALLGSKLVLPGVWCALLTVLYIVHFGMLMSLTFRWWWLAVVVVLGMLLPVSPFLVMMAAASGWAQLLFIVPDALLVVMIYVLQRGIGSSLEKAAAV